MFDIVCLGELLIDFVATATGSLVDAPGFVKAAGGAPANVAVAAARLGRKVAFLGAAGQDEFGSFLRAQLESNGVDVRGLHLSRRGSTPLAFVSLKENAERDFLFYWRDTADHLVKPRDIPSELAADCRIFHYGSISLIHPAMREVTRRALQAARRSRTVFVSCDPNLRLNLWNSPEQARKKILKAIESANLVKINDEELEFLTGKKDLWRGMRALARFTDAAILVTRGPAGAAYHWGKGEGETPGFTVSAVDSTGAGDGFVAGFLSQLIELPANLREHIPEAQALARWVRYANAVGALATTKRGAIPAFPARSEVEAFLTMEMQRGRRPRPN
jgi:fructokinase